jgi:c-di-GMP-binding flagellar brake protein YcgR
MFEIQDLQPITYDKDRERFWNELVEHVQLSREQIVTAITTDHHAFQFHLKDASGQMLSLQSASPSNREIKVGEHVQLAIGLDDGQFFVRSYVQSVEHGLIRVPFRIDTELLLLQRRDSLRAKISAESRVMFEIASSGSTPQNPLIPVRPINLSAGGMRLQWPLLDLGEPKVGQAVGGFMMIQSRRIEIFGYIQAVYPDGHGVQVGVAFQNLSVRDEQALLFLCLELRRQELNIRP